MSPTQQAQPIRFDDRTAFRAWVERQPAGRWTEGRLLTRIAGEGRLDLDPPGITLAVADLYRDTGVPGAPRG